MLTKTIDLSFLPLLLNYMYNFGIVDKILIHKDIIIPTINNILKCTQNIVTEHMIFSVLIILFGKLTTI